MRLLVLCVLTMAVIAAPAVAQSDSGFDISDLAGEEFFFDDLEVSKTAKGSDKVGKVKGDVELKAYLEFHSNFRWTLFLVDFDTKDADSGDSKYFPLASGFYYRKRDDDKKIWLCIEDSSYTTHGCTSLLNELDDDNYWWVNSISKSKLQVKLKEKHGEWTAKLTGRLKMFGRAYSGGGSDGGKSGESAKIVAKIKGEGVLD